jgi:hypothetical protein
MGSSPVPSKLPFPGTDGICRRVNLKGKVFVVYFGRAIFRVRGVHADNCPENRSKRCDIIDDWKLSQNSGRSVTYLLVTDEHVSLNCAVMRVRMVETDPSNSTF